MQSLYLNLALSLSSHLYLCNAGQETPPITACHNDGVSARRRCFPLDYITLGKGS